ncbi:GAF domain-containing protein [Haloarcula salinisoli]|uniref:GAF domain-containing protein n=1 Tax=Haloarcula salinisoli TaxID=2487746 RepID=A0A8J7YFP6_9EURY|nr:GAF domain-containing protein [Halomicroarcula salinisoli]MBX0305075.1 GAF domain-containing protein [Halomicroarcula salinisoli]
MSAELPTVVCVDGDDETRSATVEALETAGFEVRPCDSVVAVETAMDDSVGCVVTTATLPDGDGFDVVELVRDRRPDCPCIFFTGDPPADLPRGGRDQVVEYVPRSVPGAHDRLVEVVTAAATEVTQAAYPLPEDETERLAALAEYDVDELSALDTFERLTSLITSHFDIDVAFVGLVGAQEERFVACEGANWRTLSREDTICTHTILTDDVMVVENVQEDPRFAAVERLEELDIRSYAGARITDDDGNALGAVCCIHGEPRSYTQAEREDLRRFADEVQEQLALRRRLGMGGD